MLHRLVALTRSVFQMLAVHDSYRSAHVLYAARALENAGSQGDTRASRTQHLRQELVRDREKIRIDAIPAHQEPARQQLLDFMKPIASGDLRHLQSLD